MSKAAALLQPTETVTHQTMEAHIALYAGSPEESLGMRLEATERATRTNHSRPVGRAVVLDPDDVSFLQVVDCREEQTSSTHARVGTFHSSQQPPLNPRPKEAA